MNKAPLVSIALCTYNGSAYLKEQLDSIVNQTYTDLEIIIVDDGSTDGTVAILNHYAQQYPGVSLFYNAENLGYIKNFERAISICNGDYIALCDQDDIWDKNKISILVENIAGHILVYHDSEFVDEQGNALNKKVSDIRNCYSGSDSRIFLFENCVSGHAMLFKRTLLDHFEGFNKIIMHDWWLTYIAANNGSILYIDQVLVKYRQHHSANTNILRQDRSNIKKENSLEKISRQLNLTRVFVSYPYNKDKAFKIQLLNLMENRIKSYFSFDLAWFIYRNHNLLLYIQKKSPFSKLNFILKFLWGYKTKRLLSNSGR